MSVPYYICGIQQVGIGVSDANKSWAWYRKFFGTDVPVVDDKAVANLMLRYTGGESRTRHAIIALNMQGGGGLEIWQYVCRKPQAADITIQVGDLGVFATKIKCQNVEQTHAYFTEKGMKNISISQLPDGNKVFYVNDESGNLFQLTEGQDWFQQSKKPTGGVYGAMLGVTDIEKSLRLYRDILGYDQVVYDQSGQFDDLSLLAGGSQRFRRVLLRHAQPRKGAFSRLLGSSELELVQALDREPVRMFENRFWGDLGFIHLCFDVANMDALKVTCAEMGFPFTVDSANTFDMGDAGGRFSYIEDPDGTLIEFVETHKVPIFKRFGIYLNLSNRNPEKPLPNWMLKALGMNRKKD
ncbi:MAG: VOC family protein [Spirosomataceae bacterium]